jgi:hypothetical protein
VPEAERPTTRPQPYKNEGCPNSFRSSVRKQLRQAPKFYLFDTGVTRALGRMLQAKRTAQVREDHAAPLRALVPDFPDADAFLLSRDPHPHRLGPLQALPWWEGLLAL